jgi:Predicted RNA-binding protein
VLNERKKGPFKSFQDLTGRVKGVYNPEKLVSNRIEEELMDGRIRYRIFTREPRKR